MITNTRSHDVNIAEFNAETQLFLNSLSANGFYVKIDPELVDLGTELIGASKLGRKMSVVTPAPGLVATGKKKLYAPTYTTYLDKDGNAKTPLQKQLDSIQQVIAIEGDGYLRVIDENEKDVIPPVKVQERDVVKKIQRDNPQQPEF